MRTEVRVCYRQSPGVEYTAEKKSQVYYNMFTCSKCAFAIQGRPNFCPSCGSSLTYSEPNDLDPMLGRVLAGTYELLSIAGEGAMGKVYQAYHRTLDKHVAVKVLRKNWSAIPQ